MSIQAEARCGGEYGDVNGAIACFHYLNSLGTQQCGVPVSQRSVVMCRAGRASITGYGIGHSSWWYVLTDPFRWGNFQTKEESS